MNPYEQKQEEKRERMRARAERRRQEAEGRYKQATNAFDQMNGQPILVGHHSEKRHRRQIAKADNNMRRSFELEKEAAELERRAGAIGTAGISSDDPEAVVKLKETIAEIEGQHDREKRANASYRRMPFTGNDLDLQEQRGSFSESVRDVMEILGWSFHELRQEIATRERVRGRPGDPRPVELFPRYVFANRNNNLRRYKLRLAQLQKVKAAVEAGALEGKREQYGDIQVIDDVSENRVRVKFPGKPAREVIAELKSSGFRWSPNNGDWRRHRGAYALQRAREIAKKTSGQTSQGDEKSSEPRRCLGCPSGQCSCGALSEYEYHYRASAICRDNDCPGGCPGRCLCGTRYAVPGDVTTCPNCGPEGNPKGEALAGQLGQGG